MGPGGLATPGVELVAEVGSVRLLRQEFAEAIDAGTALGFAQGATFNSPGTNRFLVETSDAFPLVSLVSMIAPSPDWFVGVRGLDLRDDSGWIEELTIPLLPYDAGTESGEGFRTSNPATDPAAPIASLDDDESSVFFQSGPLGTLRFQRLAACDLNGDGRCDVADLNSNSGLYSAGDLAQGVAVTLGVNSRFDLNGDAMIDGSDLDRWLDLAATHNGFAEPYLRGDTNLNDHVGFGDFLSLSRAFGTGVEWSEGNYGRQSANRFWRFPYAFWELWKADPPCQCSRTKRVVDCGSRSRMSLEVAKNRPPVGLMTLSGADSTTPGLRAILGGTIIAGDYHRGGLSSRGTIIAGDCHPHDSVD